MMPEIPFTFYLFIYYYYYFNSGQSMMKHGKTERFVSSMNVMFDKL